MGPATQSPKLSTGIIEIGWLLKPRAAANKDLIGADNQSPVMVFRHPPRLDLGERKGAVRCSPAIGPKDLLDCVLVNQSGFHTNFEAASREQASPRRAPRGQDQLLIHPCRAAAPAA